MLERLIPGWMRPGPRLQATRDELPGPEELRSLTEPRVASWQVSTPHYPSPGKRNRLNQYLNGGTAFVACVNTIERACRQVGLIVVDADGVKVERTSIERFLNATGNVATMAEMITRFIQDLHIYGDSIWEVVENRNGGPGALYRIDPMRTAIRLDRVTGVPNQYLVNTDAKWSPVPAENIVHLKHPDPHPDYWYGRPPIAGAMRSLVADSRMSDMININLENHGTPQIVLQQTEPKNPSVTPVNLSPTEKRSLARAWSRNRKKNAPHVLGYQVKAEVLGMTWRDMELGEISQVPAKAIAGVMGVPHMLLGFGGNVGDPTHANYRDAKEHLYEDTVAGTMDAICQVLTVALSHWFPKLGAAYSIAPDYRAVPVLQEARLRRLAMATEAFERGTVSRRPAQRLAGVPEHGPDVFYRPSSVGGIVAGDASVEEIEKPPPPMAPSPAPDPGDNEEPEDE